MMFVKCTIWIPSHLNSRILLKRVKEFIQMLKLSNMSSNFSLKVHHMKIMTRCAFLSYLKLLFKQKNILFLWVLIWSLSLNVKSVILLLFLFWTFKKNPKIRKILPLQIGLHLLKVKYFVVLKTVKRVCLDNLRWVTMKT